MNAAKSFDIPKDLVMRAYQSVKSNAGAAGIDKQSIEDLERDIKGNLYKIWNRMSSGSYFPPAVKAVAIPKKNGGERILGVPTVSDRIAQAIVKDVFEPLVECHFLDDSYGYRPGRSAHHAIRATAKRCWKDPWVLEFDIKGLFDNIDHDLLMKAVRFHTNCSWVLLYIERWLKAPMQMPDGSVVKRTRGTPQGGVISPILANLFMHYVFDVWMSRKFPDLKWCRYADDGLVHCPREFDACRVLEALTKRLNDSGLELHPIKTRIVYCKTSRRRGAYPNVTFDFLGYTFGPCAALDRKTGELFLSFLPKVSKSSLKAMRLRVRQLAVRRRTDLDLKVIAEFCNPILRGWATYYGAFYPSALNAIWRYIDLTLAAWAHDKYFKGHQTRARRFIVKMRTKQPDLFYHWKLTKS